MSKGKDTRDNILSMAFKLASENGLESLTIGELAKQCKMSKSGLFAHFNSKDNLQIAVLEYANDVFVQRVIAPVRAKVNITFEQKIKALLENWLSWNHSFQGSCMFLDAWKETCNEHQPTQQALKTIIGSWITYIEIQLQKGTKQGEFLPSTDPKQAAFELYGLYLSAHLFYSIEGQEASQQHFWQGVDRLFSSWK